MKNLLLFLIVYLLIFQKLTLAQTQDTLQWKKSGLTSAFKDSFIGVRSSAARALGNMGKEGAVYAPQVAELLKSDVDYVRNSAALALGNMGKEGAVYAPQLAELLKSDDNYVRSSAARALGNMGKEGANVAPQVAELLKSDDDYVRRSAAYALGDMGKEGAVYAPQVAELLKSDDDYVRRSAARALGNMGKEGAVYAPQVAELLKSDDNDVRSSAAEALGDMGKEGIAYAPQLAELLKSDDDYVRRSAAEALGDMGKEGAVYAPQVAELLKSDDDYVRRSAVYALGDMEKEGAVYAPQVAELLKSDDNYVRSSTAEALGNMGKEGAVYAPQLAELLKSDDNFVRSSAAYALGNMGKEGTAYAPQLAELLKSDDNDVRRSAARGLGNMGKEGAVYAPQLAELLKSDDDYVRRSAAYALGDMGKEGAVYAPQLAELLKSDDDYVRRSAAYALGNMGKEGAVYAPQLAELLKSDDNYVRSSAAEALGNMNSKFNTTSILYILTAVQSEYDELYTKLRFLAHYSSGGQNFVHWLGKPTAFPEKLDKNEAIETLNIFEFAWKNIDSLSNLRDDLIEATKEIIGDRITNWDESDISLLKKHSKFLERVPEKVIVDEEIEKIETWENIYKLILPVSGIILLNFLIPIAAIRYPLARRIVFDPIGSHLLGIIFGKYLIIDVLIFYVKPIKLALFKHYRQELKKNAPLITKWEKLMYVNPFFGKKETLPKDINGNESNWIDSFQEIIDTPNKNILYLIEGRSGLGKTALLEQWTKFSLEISKTPLFIALGNNSSITEEVAHIIEQYGDISLSPEKAYKLIKEGGYIIFLDGLNESADVSNVERFIRQVVKRNHVFITSQFNPNWKSVKIERFGLKAFSKNQLKEILGEDWVESILKSKILKEIVKLPHTTFLLKNYLNEKHELPNSVLEIYSILIEKVDNEDKITSLGQKAWDLFKENKESFEAKDPLTIEFCNEAVGYGVLTKKGGDSFAFKHEMISRFLVSSHLFYHFNELNLDKLHEKLINIERDRYYWIDVLELLGEMYVERAIKQDGSFDDYFAFLKQVGTFDKRILQNSLYHQYKRYVESGTIAIDNEFGSWVADCLSGVDRING